jgi:hypothetical protein
VADEDEGGTDDRAEDWEARFRAYMKAARSDDKEQAASSSKKGAGPLQRVAAYRHLRCLDAQLRAVCGDSKGLAVFLRPDRDIDTAPNWDTVPVLILGEDESSINLSAQWHLLYRHKAMLCVWPDPWHRVWADCADGLSHGGFRTVIQALTLCMNMPFGPWQGQKFFCEVSEAGHDMLQLLRDGDPLIRGVVADVGLSFAMALF